MKGVSMLCLVGILLAVPTAMLGQPRQIAPVSTDSLIKWLNDHDHQSIDQAIIWPRHYGRRTLQLLDSLATNWSATDTLSNLMLEAYRSWVGIYHPDYSSIVDSTTLHFHNRAKELRLAFWRQRIGYVMIKRMIIQGNYTQPLNELRKYGGRGRNIHDTTLHIEALLDLGSVALELNNTASAQKHFNHALRFAYPSGNCASIVRCLQAIAMVNGLEGETDSTRYFFEKAWRIHETCTFSGLQTTAEILVQVGRYQIKLGWLSEADRNLERSASIYRQLKQEEEATKISLLLARSAFRAQSMQRAKELALDVLQNSYFTGQRRQRLHALDLLYRVELEEGDYKQAFAFFQQYTSLEDSLSDRVAADALARLEMQLSFQQEQLADSLQYANKALQRELEQEKVLQQEKRRRYILLFIGLSVLIVAIFLWLRLRQSREARDAIEREKQRSDELLLNILPHKIAEELKERGTVNARLYPTVHILFTDFVDFTHTAATMSAEELVKEIDVCFRAFDAIMENYGLEKIKTIGDAYMAASGIASSIGEEVTQAEKLAFAALDMLHFIGERQKTRQSNGKPAFSMRAGIHTGSVIAGVVGSKKFQFDLWGDAVNTASRCESNSEPHQLNVSETTALLLKNSPSLRLQERLPIEVKGKGLMKMFFVQRNRT